ncbi:MAG: hypothetical protein WAL50_20445 [Kineosporiaceae bacterium]
MREWQGRPLDRLYPTPVRETVVRLENRIEARFPGRSLRQVAAELATLADDVAMGSATARRRMLVVRTVSRTLTAVVVVAALVTLVFAFQDAGSAGPQRSFEWLALIESAVNDLIFAGLAVFFLYALPTRLERRQILVLLHRLRSLAHIIDMHQLTKDPERLRPEFRETPVSVDPDLDRAGMENYLDYCSELLSLVGKVAALCAEESQDPVILDTVSTIETLTTGMSRKIWQKISLLAT